MIAEQALRAILQTQTDLIYNLLEREENNKPKPDEKKIELLMGYKNSLIDLVNNHLIK